jgi:transcriptional regulator with XRE-family HTH domain
MAKPQRKKPAALELLAEFIRVHGLSLRDAARGIGTSKTSLIFWLRGDQRPRAEVRDAIEKWTSGAVPASSWLLPGEVLPVDRVSPFTPTKAA